MNILFICNTSPFETDMGNAQRTSIFLKAFLNNRCIVDIVNIGTKNVSRPSVIPENVNIVYWNEGSQWKRNINHKWKNFLLKKSNVSTYELEQKICTIVNNKDYDYIFCRYIVNAQLTGIFNLNNRVILDIDDLPEIRFRTSVQFEKNVLKRIYHKYVFYRLKKQTKDSIRKSAFSFLPNKKEADEYNVWYLPNISTIHINKFGITKSNHTILFVGLMSWAPNYKGLDIFITNCWSDILLRVPDAKLLVAGKGLPIEYSEKWSKYRNVIYLGYVDDINDFYSKGNIVICPIFSGAGTNIKVIEAMSMGKACVISTLGTRGYEHILEDNVNALIAKDNFSFTNSVVNLLENESICDKIGRHAFEMSSEYFSQESIDSIIGKLLNE